MKTKEEIIKILKNNFYYVYCHSCAFQHDRKGCDECHRKYMNWSISDEEAEGIANEILS